MRLREAFPKLFYALDDESFTDFADTTLGRNYGSNAGTLRTANRFNMEDFEREEDDDEDYEERHDDKVIDDYESIDRVKEASARFFEEERERQ
ncbi:hypothetical protein SAMN02910301_2243 [Lachnospiraceae bacterium XBD2001]|nr:hypothetical protein SAMN02910301_2243 [Lachnospiraceae bacterium XBD2001]